MAVGIIDQTVLPHRFAPLRLTTLRRRPRTPSARMQMRGAPLIGAVAAYGMALALRADASDENLERAYATLLRDAADRDQSEMGAGRDDGGGSQPCRATQRVAAAYRRAAEICDEDVAINQAHRPPRADADRGRSPRARSRASRSTC